jgi:hypothetical protein
VLVGRIVHSQPQDLYNNLDKSLFILCGGALSCWIKIVCCLISGGQHGTTSGRSLFKKNHNTAAVIDMDFNISVPFFL